MSIEDKREIFSQTVFIKMKHTKPYPYKHARKRKKGNEKGRNTSMNTTLEMKSHHNRASNDRVDNNEGNLHNILQHERTLHCTKLRIKRKESNKLPQSQNTFGAVYLLLFF